MATEGRAGELVGAYRLVAPIGRGGMGEVWRAEHVQIGSVVAIKLVVGDPEDVETATRFLREAKAAARIRHPGIVAVTDYGERPGGGAYMVMELLEGQSLASRLAGGALDPELAVEIATQIAEALVAAHEAEVVHRDLKPGNVFLTPDPAARGGLRVKLLDFGVAKSTRKVTDEHGLTMTGALVGTPFYMAPEQCTSRRGAIDHRTDLYALGVVLHEMLSGTPPFVGPALGDVIEQHLSEPPPGLRVRDPAIPAWLDELVLLLLAKQRDGRPPRAAAVVEALRTKSVVAARPSAPELSLASTGVGAPPPVSALSGTVADTAIQPSGTAATLHSAELPAVTSDALPKTPITSTAPIVSSRRWLVVGGVVVAAIAIGVVAFGVTRGTPDAPREPAIELATLDEAGLAKACDAGNGEACLRSADAMRAGTTPPELPRVFARVQAACDAGVMRGCARLARMYQRGVGVPADASVARQQAERACTSNDAEACTVLAELFDKGAGVAADRERAQGLWTRACELGDPEGCTARAKAMHYGLGTARDPLAAKQLYQRAEELAGAGCAKGNPEACYNAGLLRYRGVAGPKDLPRAATLIQKACELGSAEACGDVGQLVLLGSGVSADPKRAAQLIRRGCDRGAPEACIALAIVLGSGLSGPADPAASMALAKRVCETHGDVFCTQVARNYVLGIGATADPRMAQTFYERGCKAGDPDACSGLAELKIPGEPRDPARVARELARACTLGSAVACLRRGTLARKRDDHAEAYRSFEQACGLSDGEVGCPELAGMHIDGLHVEHNPARGLEILASNCDHGMQVNCHALGVRLRDGAGVPARPAEAAIRFEKACELGYGSSCVALADMLSSPDSTLTPDPARAHALRDKGCKLEARLCPKEPAPKPDPKPAPKPTPTR